MINIIKMPYVCPSLLGFILLVSACHSGGGQHPGNVAQFKIAPWGISSIKFNNTEVVAPGGGLYAIGSCTGIDNPISNVDTRRGNGTALVSPDGSCPPIPFSKAIGISGSHVAHSIMTIGPTPMAYATLSVPLDLAKDKIVGYEFAAAPVFFNDNVTIGKQYGLYTDIPTPFVLPGLLGKKVGFAHANKSQSWIEATTPNGAIHVRRMFYVGSSLTDVYVYNHPDTNNLEASFHGVPKGVTLRLEEDVIVY